jgi:hypothetical protein
MAIGFQATYVCTIKIGQNFITEAGDGIRMGDYVYGYSERESQRL